MPSYVWRARDRQGALARGKAEATDPMDLASRLRAQGFVVLGVDPDNDLGQFVKAQSSLFPRRKVKGEALAAFCRQFATMVEAGLPILSALNVLIRQAGDPALRTALEKVARAVNDGESLAGAMAASGAFPPLVIHMVAAGEVGGMLEEVLLRLASQIEKDEAIRAKVRSALAYPTAVSIIAVCVIVFMMTFVAPKFVQIYGDMGAQLPLPTRILIAVSDFFVYRWWVMLTMLAGAALAGWRFVRSAGGRFWVDRNKLRIPVLGMLMLKAVTARLCRTLGGMLGAGVPILQAILVVDRVVDNAAVSRALMAALDNVRAGGSMVPALAESKLFPPMALEMVLVGEETGQMEEMLSRVADYYENDVQRMAERLSALLEPVIVVCLGVTVGLIVASLLLPIFNMWDLLSGG